MNNDLISREALLFEIRQQLAFQKEKAKLTTIDADKMSHSLFATGIQLAIDIIDNAPTVDAIPNAEGYEMYNKGYVQGYERGKAEARPQGEYVDISKLRLMTVEECAGHTIDYAMGWKACIEWIKERKNEE